MGIIHMLLIVCLALVVNAKINPVILNSQGIRRTFTLREEEERLPYQNVAAFIDYDDKDFTHLEASYIVPPFPGNNSKDVQFGIIMQTPGFGGFDPEPVDTNIINLAFDSSSSEWVIFACTCSDVLACECEQSQPVTPGERVHISMMIEDDEWVLSAYTENVEISISAPAEDFQSLGQISMQWTQRLISNCNMLPESNGILISDIIIKDSGADFKNILWRNHYSLTPCSLAIVHADDKYIKIGWNSNDWTGNQPGACLAKVTNHPQGSWIENGVKYTNFIADIRNYGEADLEGINFKLEKEVSQIWNLDQHENGSYSIPDYGLPLPLLNEYRFGYIATDSLRVKEVYCLGGDSLTIGDQPGFVHEIFSIPQSGECLVEFVQRVVSSWEGALQISVEIKNAADLTITNLEFSSPQASLIQQAWIVERLENGHYKLPSWVPSLSSGSSLSFGYVVASEEAVSFEISQISC